MEISKIKCIINIGEYLFVAFRKGSLNNLKKGIGKQI